MFLGKNPFRISTTILSVALVAFSMNVYAGQVAGGEEGVRMYSPELLDALDRWQTQQEPMSIAELLADEGSEILSHWTDGAIAVMGGSIVDTFGAERPELLEEFRADFMDDPESRDDLSFVYYLIEVHPGEFSELDAAVGSKKRGTTLSTLVEAENPELFNTLEEHNRDLRAYPMSFMEFVETEMAGSVTMISQAQTYVDDILDFQAPPPSTCFCQINASTQLSSSPPSSFSDGEQKSNGSWKWYENWSRTSHGPAQRHRSNRFSKRFSQADDEDFDVPPSRSSTYIQFSMDCHQLDNNGALVQCDSGRGCTADVKVDARYKSDLYVWNDDKNLVPFSWGKSSATASDMAFLTLNPGGSDSQTLFEKGLALHQEHGQTFDLAAAVATIKTGYNIYTDVKDSDDFNDVITNLDSEQLQAGYQSFIGIIDESGATGSLYEDFVARYTNGGSPFLLEQGKSLRFVLESINFGRSWGKGYKAWGTTQVDSDFFLAGLAKNFSCNQATAPKHTAAWSYARSQGSANTLQGLESSVGSFFTGEGFGAVNPSAYHGTWSAP